MHSRTDILRESSTERLKEDRRRLKEALDTRALGRVVRWHESLPSTNDTAKHWADDGAPHGALVFCDHQTGGRGRHGRSWIADPGVNVTVSIVLRPSFPRSLFSLITPAAGLAVSRSIEACCPGVHTLIKWPNDIQIDGRKCCGMLLESVIGKNASDSFVVLGVGINVNQSSFPGDMAQTATSLALGYGQPVDRIMILADVLARLEEAVGQLESRTARVLESYERRLDGLGGACRVTDVQTGTVHEGILEGIDVNGALRLSTDSGERLFHAGEVQSLRSLT